MITMLADNLPHLQLLDVVQCSAAVVVVVVELYCSCGVSVICIV